MDPQDNNHSPSKQLHSDESIGQRLRARRKVRKISLKDVARQADISIGLLSQIERGLSIPTVRSLTGICAALEMPISWLFESPQEGDDKGNPLVVRKSQRRVLDLGAKGMVKELMTPDECNGIQMMRIIIRINGSTGDIPYNHSFGAKCGTVLAGVLGIETDGTEHLLEPGDSIAFDATRMIRLYAAGDSEVEVLWIVSPAVY